MTRKQPIRVKIPEDYSKFLKDLTNRVKTAQVTALKAVNKELLALYWDIGRLIVEKQSERQWGDAVIERLANDLQKIFPGIKGFSTRNIWRMRDLYLSYAAQEKLLPLVKEVAWTNHITILEKCKDPLEREFYIRMVRKFGWTKQELINNIANQIYERTLLNQTNFEKNLPATIRDKAKLAIKDEYTFDFLELEDSHSERQLENAIIAKIEYFLREMGGLFAFIGRQYRLEVDNKEYFIDLLLFHRQLKCLVVIELKIGEFIPEYIGKMQFYLSALDALVKLKDENPSIGIILCRTKSQTTVEYALKDSNKPVGVAAYQIVKALPKNLRDKLPTAEQIIDLLKEIE